MPSRFPPKGMTAMPGWWCEAYELGWRRFIGYGYRGQRFLGCGLGPDTQGVRIDAYGSSGDYLGSGMDGLEIYVHGNAQDQLGQILKSGKTGGVRGRGPDLPVRRQGRGGLCPRQRRRPAPDQRRGQAQGGHQRHGPGFSGRIFHGRRSL